MPQREGTHRGLWVKKQSVYPLRRDETRRVLQCRRSLLVDVMRQKGRETGGGRVFSEYTKQTLSPHSPSVLWSWREADMKLSLKPYSPIHCCLGVGTIRKKKKKNSLPFTGFPWCSRDPLALVKHPITTQPCDVGCVLLTATFGGALSENEEEAGVH